MRVAIDISICTFNKAGSARYARALLDALQEEASKSDVMLVPLDLPRSLQATAPSSRRKAVTLFWEMVYAPWLLPLLCQRHRCDLLHTTIPTPVRTLSLPIVTTVHDVIPALYPQWFPRMMGLRLQRWLRVAAKAATHIIANSKNTARDLATLNLASPDTPITAIYPGSFLTSTATSDGLLQGDGAYILSVGTLEPRKNLATVLEAYALLLRGGVEPPKLLVAGAADWMASDVEAYATRLGLSGKVELAGFVSDERLQALYQGATMLVFPSLYEGFGFPPLEAMSNGCPVIASSVSSLPEVVGEAGVLVEPTNAAQLAEAMRQMLADPEWVERLRQRGYEQASRFTWKQCAQETVAVYRQAVEQRAWNDKPPRAAPARMEQ